MEVYLIWIPLILSGLSVLIALFLSLTQLRAIQKRLIVVEREMSLARTREARQEHRLQEVVGAAAALKNDTDALLRGMREKLALLLLNFSAGRGSQE